MLTPIIESFVQRLNIYINIILRIAPDRLKKKAILNKPILSIPTNITRIIDIVIASLKENSYNVNNITILASPSFNPGIVPLNIGIIDSTKFKTTDKEKKGNNKYN